MQLCQRLLRGIYHPRRGDMDFSPVQFLLWPALSDLLLCAPAVVFDVGYIRWLPLAPEKEEDRSGAQCEECHRSQDDARNLTPCYAAAAD